MTTKPTPTEVFVVLSTAPSADEANRLATALVERRLAACVNVLPGVESIYRWKDEVERAHEWLLVIKTTRGGFDALAEAIRELHPYEVPELLALSVERGAPSYLTWVAENVGGGGGGG